MDDGGVRWRLFLDAFRAWVPIVVSLCAISLTVYQANAMRRHNRLAVQPHIDVHLLMDRDGAGEVEIEIADVGIGPAVITEVALAQGGLHFDRSDFAACQALDDRLGRTGDDWDTECFLMDGDYVLRPGDQATLYASRRAEGRPQAPVAPPQDYDSLEVDVRYCSFYDECWRASDR
jgi:hypothetical protein